MGGERSKERKGRYKGKEGKVGGREGDGRAEIGRDREANGIRKVRGEMEGGREE